MWQHDFVRVNESPTQKTTNMDVTNTLIIVKVLTLQINAFWNIEYTETFKYVNVRGSFLRLTVEQFKQKLIDVDVIIL